MHLAPLHPAPFRLSQQYQREPDLGEGLRLHLNENTAGCSPAVIAALRALDPHAIASYPDYREVTRACGLHLGLDEDAFVLTNGLDEGLLAASIAYLQRGPSTPAPEAIIVEPAFGMYAGLRGGHRRSRCDRSAARGLCVSRSRGRSRPSRPTRGSCS